MTAFFHAAIAISLLRVFKEHEWKQDKLVYYTPVSLRQYVSKMDPLNMGYCVGGLLSILDVESIDVCNENDLVGNFWTIARDINGTLHKRINEDNEKFQLQLSQLDEPDKQLHFHYLLSNPGFVDTKSLEDIQIESLFSAACFKNDNRDLIFGNIVNTVNGKFCWSVPFNSYFTQRDIIESYVKKFEEIIEKVVSLE